MNIVQLKTLGCAILLNLLAFSNLLEGAWSAPITISQATIDSRFNRLAGSNDDFIAVWLSFDDISNTDSLYASVCNSVGVWSVPVAVSTGMWKITDAQLIVDSNHQAILVWVASNSNQHVFAARLPDGGSWTSPEIVYTTGLEKI